MTALMAFFGLGLWWQRVAVTQPDWLAGGTAAVVGGLLTVLLFVSLQFPGADR